MCNPKCANKMFKFKQKWEFQSVDNENQQNISQFIGEYVSTK